MNLHNTVFTVKYATLQYILKYSAEICNRVAHIGMSYPLVHFQVECCDMQQLGTTSHSLSRTSQGPLCHLTRVHVTAGTNTTFLGFRQQAARKGGVYTYPVLHSPRRAKLCPWGVNRSYKQKMTGWLLANNRVTSRAEGVPTESNPNKVACNLRSTA